MPAPFSHLSPLFFCCAVQEALRKVFPEALGPLSAIPQTGPAPIMARVEEWVRVAPRYAGIMEQASQRVWETPDRALPLLALQPLRCMPAPALATAVRGPACAAWPLVQINGDESIIAALDWVREMWAFSVAAAVERLHLALEVRALLPQGQGGMLRLELGCVRVLRAFHLANWMHHLVRAASTGLHLSCRRTPERHPSSSSPRSTARWATHPRYTTHSAPKSRATTAQRCCGASTSGTGRSRA